MENTTPTDLKALAGFHDRLTAFSDDIRTRWGPLAFRLDRAGVAEAARLADEFRITRTTPDQGTLLSVSRAVVDVLVQRPTTAQTAATVPPELRELRKAADAFLAVLRDVEPAIEQTADVNRLRDSSYAFLLDEVRAAQRPFPRLNGTPAAIGQICAELLGEA